MSRITRTVTGLVTVTLLVASCSGDAGEPTTPSATQAGPAQLAAEVGSYDLAAGKKTRFMVGLIAGENRFVSYGTVQFAFAYLGRYEPAASGQASIIETGRFLPVPGSTAAGKPGPVAVSGADARGVYAADVTFDRPGYWGGWSMSTSKVKARPAPRPPSRSWPRIRSRPSACRRHEPGT